jgi:hypothetical protein
MLPCCGRGGTLVAVVVTVTMQPSLHWCVRVSRTGCARGCGLTIDHPACRHRWPDATPGGESRRAVCQTCLTCVFQNIADRRPPT